MRARILLTLAVVAVGLAAAGRTARAQAAQTWVSGVGDDTNPCSRTAPCLTYAAALASTAVGGEIDALDSGDFGPVTLTTSVTINGGVGAFVQTASGDGITITAGATDVVTLRNLTIHSNAPGTGNGITFNGAGALTLDGVDISGYANGIAFTPAAAAQLVASDVAIHENAVVGVSVSGAGGIAAVALTRSHIQNSVIGVDAIAGAHVTVFDSTITGNLFEGVEAILDASGGDAQINLEDVDLSDNGIGALANAVAGTATIRLSQVLATGETSATTTAENGTGQILTFGNNRLDTLPTLAFASLSGTPTIAAGATATYQTSVSFSGIHVEPITFSCAGLPAGVTCTIAPASLDPGVDSGNQIVSVATVAPTTGAGVLVVPCAPPLGLIALLGGAALLSLFVRRRRRVLQTALVAFALATACGDNIRPAAPDGTMPMGTPGTPSGTYAFTVTASCGTVQASLPFTLVVQ